MKENSNKKTDKNFGVLLFDEGWKQLEEALKPYEKKGPIGRYIYCKELSFVEHFVTMTFTPEQVDGKIGCEMTIWVPNHFIKFVAHAADKTKNPLGFG